MASLITRISRQQIDKLNVEDDALIPSEARITNAKHLGSYSWLESSEPTIVVPGLPARWAPMPGKRKIKPDSGFFYIAQNAARHPGSPMEPLFRSLFISQPAFDIRGVDVISDRNNIRKLLGFVVNKQVKRQQKEDFTIHAEIRGATTLLCRTETKVSEFLEPGMFRGYGHEFERRYTRDEIPRCTGHHRILSYQFSGMRMLVRYEADGYIDDEGDLDARLRSLSLGADAVGQTELTAPVACPGSELQVIRGGREVRPESIMEIKTRSARKPIQIADVADQLWASQTVRLARAYHEKGVFDEPDVQDVSVDIRDWESQMKHGLSRLAWLIKKIGAVTRANGGKAAVVYQAQSDELVISRWDGGDFLPEDLYAKWHSTEGPKEDGKGAVSSE